MKNIKYQPLNISNDGDVVDNINCNQQLNKSVNIYYLKKNKKYLLKRMLIFFIILILIFIIHNFDKIINLLKGHNQNYDGITNSLQYKKNYDNINTPLTISQLKNPAIKPYASKNDEKYFINTTYCHIPFVDPLTSDIQKIFKPKNSTGCTKDQAIITVSFNDSMGQYILHINHKVAEDLRKKHFAKAKPIEEDLLCCYKEVIRIESVEYSDNSIRLRPCTNFHQNYVVPLHINGIIVRCNSTMNNVTLQTDAFSFIQVNKTMIEEEFRNITKDRRKPSILMIGIDTLSRMNFRRNMPKMLKYLIKNNWYELRGYNKVGENTIPNLMPLLAGYTRQTVVAKCKPKIVAGFDNCNFIWTKFKKYGYHTAYAEDSYMVSTYNYGGTGFKEPPTDHYFRPMSIAFESQLNNTMRHDLGYCAGRRQIGEYIYDNAMNFATRYKHLPSFGFFWTNSFSHNYYSLSATMDEKILEYFEEWEKRGIIEESVVIFFSDHGVRWGPLLKLSSGYLEERLPMFFISLPKWFHQQYPDLVKNLEINQRRLTNPYDIHMTLQHLLQLGDPNYKIQQAFDCPKCQSIFKEIPEKRTCDDANIPEAYCACISYKKESKHSDQIIFIAQKIVQAINKYYENKNITSICSELKLKRITDAKQRLKDDMTAFDNIQTYMINFITLPKTLDETRFSAIVDYNVKDKIINLDVETISRQSVYENTSKCTNDKEAKKYCICKNSLN